MEQIPQILNDLQSNVDFYGIVFIMFSALVVGSGLMTVLSKKMMHAAVGLLFTLFGIAGLYALLAADFIAITQVMVYIGGILTLIIFGVMLTSRVTDIERKTDAFASVSNTAGVAIGIACAAFLSYVFVSTKWLEIPVATIPDGTITQIGTLLMTNYFAAFIVAAVLLLIAFIGAALIARRKN
ncbi:MAG: NADH-quinone oxidoreductase subunit J [Ignavibacteria bacterium]|jgi:NADH-quinone oxidoreductase subunit J|nr:NADH-quinone oxidoreductase subunit J [Ignavibacteria bacterium]